MKLSRYLLSMTCCFALLACEQKSETNEKIDSSANNTQNVTIEEDEPSHAEECLANLNIKTVHKSHHFYGTLGIDIPIALGYYKDTLTGVEYPLRGNYLYTNNGSVFPLEGSQVGGDIYLTRFKDGKERENFILEDFGEHLDGFWKKEQETKGIDLYERHWSTNELETFATVISNEIAHLDLDFYDTYDFSDLVLDNGTLTIRKYDGGTTGGMELVDTYRLLDIKEDGQVLFMHIATEIISSWLSMDDIEAGLTEDDIEGENYHSIYIELLNYSGGYAEVLDTRNLDGLDEVNTIIIHNYAVVNQNNETHVIGWEKGNKLVEIK